MTHPGDLYATALIIAVLVGVIVGWMVWAYRQASRPPRSTAANDDVFAVDPETQEEAGEWGMLWPM